MTRTSFLLIFLLSFSHLTEANDIILLQSKADNGVVSGACQNCIGQSIRLIMYDDLLSYREVELDQKQVADDGSFQLKFNLSEVRYAWVEVDRFRYDFFLSPGKDLKLAFNLILDEKEVQLPLRGYFNRVPSFVDSPGAGLNRDIQGFNKKLDAFLESNYKMMVNRNAPALVGKAVDRFKHQMDSVYANARGYFADHIRYAIANVEQTSFRRTKYLYKDYLADGQMLYNNLEFMKFFQQFHSRSMAKQATGDKIKEYKEAFKKPRPDGDFLSLLMEEPNLENVAQRQAVYLRGLSELCGTGMYNQAKLVAMMDRFGMTSSNSDLGRAAKNLAWKYGRFLVGKKAPAFFARTITGDLISAKTFEGSPVLVEFTRVGNPMCERETVILPDLMKQYPNFRQVSFILSEDKQATTKFVSEVGIDWPVVHITENSKILENLDVRSVPTYMIFDGDWRILLYSAIEPSRGLDRNLYQVKNAKKEKFSIGEK